MRTRSVAKRKAPACTHITMERISLSESGYDQCPNCGNFQTLGFLYVCRQECDVLYLESKPTTGSDARAKSTKSGLRRELEYIGLSDSVIAAAEYGLYTDQQLEKLKAQKIELNRVIANIRQGGWARDAVVSDATNPDDPPNNDGALNSTLPKEWSPSCTLLACHHCRPYYRDRISTSVEAVLTEEIRPFHPREADSLPIKSASIMRGIGLRPSPLTLSSTTMPTASTPLGSDIAVESPSTPSQSSVLTYQTTQSEADVLDSSRRHLRRFYMMGHRTSGEIGRDLSRLSLFSRQGLRTALQGLFRPSRESSSSGSNITLPMPRTAVARDPGDDSNMGEFDLGALRRVRRQKERSDLRNNTYTGGFEDVNGPSRRQTSTSRMDTSDVESDSSGSKLSVYSDSSAGSEVEVEGGVALTEEAIETHTPDILSESSSHLETGGSKPRLDLSSIMSQV